MRSQRLPNTPPKSKFPIEIMLTIEEARTLVECDPSTLGNLETFLKHLGLEKPEKTPEKGKKNVGVADSKSKA